MLFSFACPVKSAGFLQVKDYSMSQESVSYGMNDPVNDSGFHSCNEEVFFSQKKFRLQKTSSRQLLHTGFAYLHPGIRNGLNYINLDYLIEKASFEDKNITDACSSSLY